MFLIFFYCLDIGGGGGWGGGGGVFPSWIFLCYQLVWFMVFNATFRVQTYKFSGDKHWLHM
jgi:hypothetical protein